MLGLLSILALSATLLPAALAQDVSYAACMPSRPAGLEQIVPLSSLGSGNSPCAVHCRNLNFQYAFYQPEGTGDCGCRSVGPSATEYGGSDNIDLLCENTDYWVDITLTTFGTPTCYTGYNDGLSVGNDPTLNFLSPITQVNDVGACFRNCIQWQGASIRPQGDVYDCQCDASAGDLLPAPSNCQPGTMLRFAGHPPGATAAAPAGQSVWVKRQLRDQIRMEQEMNAGKLCPGDARACLTSPGAMTWECVEVDAELESCGGCLYGDYGDARKTSGAGAVDCSAIPGIRLGGVTCEHGQCAVWACDDGFKLVGRECIPEA